MTEVRRVAWPDYEAPEWSDPQQFQQGIAGSLELFFWLSHHSRSSSAKLQDTLSCVSAHRSGWIQASDRPGVYLRTQIPCSFWVGHHGDGPECRVGRDRSAEELSKTRRDLSDSWPHHEVAFQMIQTCATWSTPPRRCVGPSSATLWQVYAFCDERTRNPGRESVRSASGA